MHRHHKQMASHDVNAATPDSPHSHIAHTRAKQVLVLFNDNAFISHYIVYWQWWANQL